MFMKRAEYENSIANIEELIRIYKEHSTDKEYVALYRLVNADSFALTFGKQEQQRQLETIIVIKSLYH